MSCISIYDHNDYDCDEFCFSILRPEESRNRESGGGRNLMRKIVIACVHCYSGANAIDIYINSVSDLMFEVNFSPYCV